MPVGPPVLVEAAPSLNPPRFGLMSAATLVPWDDQHLHNGVKLKANPHGLVGFEQTECLDEPDDPRDLTDGIPWIESSPIIVYGGFTCRSVGITDTDLQEQARGRLSAGEVAGVESRLWSTVDNSLTADATVLSETALTLPNAIGLLEQWFGARYGGTPVIHAPRRLGAVAGSKNLAVREQDKLSTNLGSTWSFGNYPGTAPTGFTPTDPDDDVPELWLVATGQVQVRRSDVEVLGGSMRSALTPATNEVAAVAHRTYVVTFDGIAAAVPVSVE